MSLNFEGSSFLPVVSDSGEEGLASPGLLQSLRCGILIGSVGLSLGQADRMRNRSQPTGRNPPSVVVGVVHDWSDGDRHRASVTLSGVYLSIPGIKVLRIDWVDHRVVTERWSSVSTATSRDEVSELQASPGTGLGEFPLNQGSTSTTATAATSAASPVLAEFVTVHPTASPATAMHPSAAASVRTMSGPQASAEAAANDRITFVEADITGASARATFRCAGRSCRAAFACRITRVRSRTALGSNS